MDTVMFNYLTTTAVLEAILNNGNVCYSDLL